jgi:hypothetical protein
LRELNVLWPTRICFVRPPSWKYIWGRRAKVCWIMFSRLPVIGPIWPIKAWEIVKGWENISTQTNYLNDQIRKSPYSERMHIHIPYTIISRKFELKRINKLKSQNELPIRKPLDSKSAMRLNISFISVVKTGN